MHPYLSYLSPQKYLRQFMPQGAERHDAATSRDGLFRRWRRAAAQNWQRRKTIAALEIMDDRLLRDIGINRDDIARAVDGFDDREMRMAPLAPTARKAETKFEVFRKAA